MILERKRKVRCLRMHTRLKLRKAKYALLYTLRRKALYSLVVENVANMQMIVEDCSSLFSRTRQEA